jgi:hypothetical protein
MLSPAHSTMLRPERSLLFLTLVAFVSLPFLAAGTPLFNGKSFEGWEGDTQKSFRIEDDAIVGGSLSERVPRNEFLCTRKTYKNFELRLKFKVVGEGANAGIQFRSQRIPNHYEVIGYQADLGDPEWWGSLYDESRRKVTLAKSDPNQIRRILKRNDWNDYLIRCEGKHIQLWINGVQTVDYTERDDSIEQDGIICVQIHGGPPSEAWYKEISLVELP